MVGLNLNGRPAPKFAICRNKLDGSESCEANFCQRSSCLETTTETCAAVHDAGLAIKLMHRNAVSVGIDQEALGNLPGAFVQSRG